MLPRFLLLPALLAAIALPALAGDDGLIPDGDVIFEKVGKVVIHTKSPLSMAKTAKSEFILEFREFEKTFAEFYRVDATELAPGGEGSRIPSVERKRVDLVLFDNEADRDDFFLKRGAPNGSAAERYTGAVYVTLAEGVVDKAGWVILARQLARAYSWHGLYFGAPTWLEMGLAEYFAWSGRHIGKPGENEEFRKMLARLGDAQTNGSETTIDALLLMTPQGWTQQQTDEAWVLAHMLATECKSTMTDLWTILSSLQANAFDRKESVPGDCMKLAKFQLERAFGGAEGLQSAWNQFRDALIKNPAAPAHLKKPPGSISDAAGFMLLDLRIHVSFTPGPNRTVVPFKCVAAGSYAYAAPWPGPITVTGAVGNAQNEWSADTEIAGDRSDKKGTPVAWKDVNLPVGQGNTQARVTVLWEVDGGAVYRARAVRPFPVR